MALLRRIKICSLDLRWYHKSFFALVLLTKGLPEADHLQAWNYRSGEE